MFLSWQSVLGTSKGNRDEFRAMLDFAARRKLVPVVDRVFRLAQGVEALRRLACGRQFGKVLLRMP